MIGNLIVAAVVATYAVWRLRDWRNVTPASAFRRVWWFSLIAVTLEVINAWLLHT
jgi:hypothetical protein